METLPQDRRDLIARVLGMHGLAEDTTVMIVDNNSDLIRSLLSPLGKAAAYSFKITDGTGEHKVILLTEEADELEGKSIFTEISDAEIVIHEALHLRQARKPVRRVSQALITILFEGEATYKIRQDLIAIFGARFLRMVKRAFKIVAETDDQGALWELGLCVEDYNYQPDALGGYLYALFPPYSLHARIVQRLEKILGKEKFARIIEEDPDMLADELGEEKLEFLEGLARFIPTFDDVSTFSGLMPWLAYREIDRLLKGQPYSQERFIAAMDKLNSILAIQQNLVNFMFAPPGDSKKKPSSMVHAERWEAETLIRLLTVCDRPLKGAYRRFNQAVQLELRENRRIVNRLMTRLFGEQNGGEISFSAANEGDKALSDFGQREKHKSGPFRETITFVVNGGYRRGEEREHPLRQFCDILGVKFEEAVFPKRIAGRISNLFNSLAGIK